MTVDRFVILQPVPEQLWDDEELRYTLLEDCWEAYLAMVGGVRVSGPLLVQELTFMPGTEPEPGFDGRYARVLGPAVPLEQVLHEPVPDVGARERSPEGNRSPDGS